MRIRTKQLGSFDAVSRLERSRECNASWSPWRSFRAINSGSVTYRRIEDVEIPNFKKLRASCPPLLLPFNPLLVETKTVTYQPGVNDVHVRLETCSSVSYEAVGPEFFGTFTLPDPLEKDLSSDIDAVMLSACASARESIHDTLTELAELRGTIDTFVSLVKRFGKLKRKVVHRAWALMKRSKGLNIVDAMTTAWLEYRYAWMPIVYSLKDIQEALSTIERGSVKGRARSVVDLSDSKTTVHLVDDGRASHSATTTITGQVTVRGYAIGTFSTGGGRFGFDPLLTAWELVTLSFVVDWFIDIGSWLQTYSPFAEGGLTNTGYSLKYEFERSYSGNISYSGALINGKYVTGGGTSGTYIEKIERYVRVPASPPFFPSFKPDLNWKRGLDLISLIHKSFR